VYANLYLRQRERGKELYVAKGNILSPHHSIDPEEDDIPTTINGWWPTGGMVDFDLVGRLNAVALTEANGKLKR
jgi:hypothetical protein